MREVYVLSQDEIIGIFSSKEKLMEKYRSILKEKIDHFKSCSQNVKKTCEKRIKIIQRILNIPDDDLFDLIVIQDKSMPWDIRSEIQWYSINKYVLDT